MQRTELRRIKALSAFEQALFQEGFSRIAGVDEAGRGPLAGPVVAAACILPKDRLFAGINDSKQLTVTERARLFSELTNCPDVEFAVSVVDVATIDRVNILQATLLGMQNAVDTLKIAPDYLLIDGNCLPFFSMPARAIVNGDARCISIAAASILAKVTRDQIMDKYDKLYPEYGFSRHKGYGTDFHLSALAEHGPCPIHRKSFAPIRTLLDAELPLTYNQ